MQLHRIYSAIDELAPFSLSKQYCEKYGAHDNSGIIVDCGEEINNILFSLDCSAAAIRRAKEINANCIVTHHPAIYMPVSQLLAEGEGKNVLACIREGISIISAHLNLDCVKDGIDESLMLALGGRNAAIMHELTGGGYGRAYDVERTDAETFAAKVKEAFRTERAMLYGGGKISRVASFCGAGLDEDAIVFAKAQGAQIVVSSDLKHHVICAAVEAGLSILTLPHYTAENYGFSRFFEAFVKKTGAKAQFFEDKRFI